MAFNAENFGSGAGGFFGGLFGNSGSGYDEYMKWLKHAQQGQQPYSDAGQGALGNYQSWLDAQKNPSQFINDQMKNYQTSDYAQNLQQQSMRAGQNAASAAGLGGSTPLFQQLQSNAGQIASQDQNQWLQNVLGINSQYGQGQQNLISGGQNAQNSLNDIYNHMGEAAYGKQAGKNQDWWNMIGGAAQIGLAFL